MSKTKRRSEVDVVDSLFSRLSIDIGDKSVSVTIRQKPKASGEEVTEKGCGCTGNCETKRCGCQKRGVLCGDHCKCSSQCENRHGSKISLPSEEPTRKPKKSDKVQPAKPEAGGPHLYVISSVVHGSSMCKLGFHTGDQKKLRSRYVTAIPDMVICCFEAHPDAKQIEKKLKAFYLADRTVSDSGKKLEWIRKPPAEVTGKVIRFLAQYDLRS